MEKVSAIKEFVSGNLDHLYTLKELSLKFDISPTAIKKCFDGIYGMSLYSYISSHRMQVAASLLCESNEKITAIALQLGYQNPSKFSAAFKKQMGMTPTEYKKVNKHRKM